MHKFVDDTTLSEIILQHESSHINEIISEVINCSNNNSMNINFSKTKELILGSMSRNPPTSIFIDGNEIQRVQVFKLLGVFIDNKFNWKSHVKAICSKAVSRLYFLRLLKRSGIS